MDAAKNFAKWPVSQGYDDVATSIVLVEFGGARFPTPPFNAVWWNSTDYPDPADDPNREIVRVTAISTDTLTVSRGHEGTGNPGVAGFEHDDVGKVYKLIAPLTAKTISDILPSTRVGNDFSVDAPGVVDMNVVSGFDLNAATVNLIGTTSTRMAASSPGMVMDISGTVAGLGDVDENNSGAALLVDDNTGVVGLRGKFATNQTAAATTPGSVTKKLEVFALDGTSLGFIAIHSSIT